MSDASKVDNVTVIPADYPCCVCGAPSAVYNMDDKCPACQKLMSGDFMATMTGNEHHRKGYSSMSNGGFMKKSYLGSHD